MKKFVVTLFFAFCATASFANTNDADLAKSKVELNSSSVQTQTTTTNLAFSGCIVDNICGNIAVVCDAEDRKFWEERYCDQ